MDRWLLILLILWVTSLTLIGGLRAHNLLLQLDYVTRFGSRRHRRRIASMHDVEIVMVASSTTVIIQELFLFDIDLVAILDAVGVSIGNIGHIAFVLLQLMHQISNASIRELHLLNFILVLISYIDSNSILVQHTLCLTMHLLHRILQSAIVLRILSNLNWLNIILTGLSLASIIFNILIRVVVHVILYVLNVLEYHLIWLLLLHVL